MNWTKRRPTEDGFYWYWEDNEPPKVIKWDNEMGWVMQAGSDIMIGDDMHYQIEGEFWPEKLTPPE